MQARSVVMVLMFVGTIGKAGGGGNRGLETVIKGGQGWTENAGGQDDVAFS